MQKVSLLLFAYKSARAYLRSEPEHLAEDFDRLTEVLNRLMT